MPKKNKRDLYFLIATIIAAALTLAGDLLIGYAVPGALGKYGMVQEGWSQVPIWRPTLSLILASVAFPFYLPGLYIVSKRIGENSPKSGKAFFLAFFAASTGWLMVHAVFCVPQFTYKYLFDAGYPDLAIKLTDKMLEMSVPSILVSALAMLVAFIILLVVIIRKRTIYSRWCVLMNPIFISLITILLVYIFPDSVFFSCLSMCKMNLGIFLFFIVAAKKEYNQQVRVLPV